MRSIRSRLFLSYLVIIVVGVVTLSVAAIVSAALFFRADIHAILADYGTNDREVAALNSAFTAGVQRALVVAALASLVAALIVSAVSSTFLARPLRQMVTAAQRIAAGNYGERVRAQGVQEIADLAVAFNQMVEALAEQERLRSAMIADLAHEIRTPLTTIRGNMEGLIDGVLAPDPAIFGTIQREARRLERLADEIGELARVESPTLHLSLAAHDPVDVLREVVARVQPQFEFKNITLALDDTALVSAPVRADRDRLEQIVLNLLSNALRYTDSGGLVTLSARQFDEHITFSVQDSGIGIAPEHLQHVFERFYRVDKSRARAQGGSGIGLPIARRLVEAQGGDIWIESTPGQGTTVFFTLPVAQSTA